MTNGRRAAGFVRRALGVVTMPDLDDATQVLFTGMSGGSVGLQQNLGRGREAAG
jgi:hypothetical protein